MWCWTPVQLFYTNVGILKLPQLYVSNCTKSSSDFPWINKCSELTALVTTKCSVFYKSFFDMDFNSVGVRNGQVAPPNHEKISLIILHTVDSVPSQCGRLAVKCPLVMKWSLGSSDFGREAGHSTAQHSSAQLAIVDQQPRQMASNQTALLAFGLD